MLLPVMTTLAATIDKIVNIDVKDDDGNTETRSYRLYVPNNVKANAPLVVSLHGANGNQWVNRPMTVEVAESEGFIVVYPQGKTVNFYLAGMNTTGWVASGEDNADVEFIKAVINDVAKNYSIDRKRVYCCGFSNGGMMTYAMTNAAADVFAAFASISGFPLNEFHLRHTGARPVPFLHIHGKADDFVKYSLMPTIVDEMVDRIGASHVPEKTTVAGKYDKSVFAAGEGGFPYVYYEVNGMGHNDITNNTEDGNSAKTMWNFMKQYTLDAPCDPTLKWRPEVDAEGYAPKSHGWAISAAMLMFGRDLRKSDNSDNNVYRSFQLTTGNYKLCFQVDGTAEQTATVKIQKLTGKKTTVLNQSVPAGEPATLLFSVEDGWGEYRFTLTRPSGAAVTNIVLYSASDEEMTGIESIPAVNPNEGTSTPIFDLMGREVSVTRDQLNAGIYLQNGKKFLKK